MLNILLVEDDPIIGRGLDISLSLEGMKLTQVVDLSSARQILKTRNFDLILLDIHLPDGKGFQFCKELRELKIDTPIIAITASLDDDTAITTLGFGANDYVRKPFSNKELIYRIRLRAKESHDDSTLTIADLKIDLGKRRVSHGNETIGLTRKEFDLLVLLSKRVDHVFLRDDILQALDTELDINDRTIDSHISHLRSKLKRHGYHRIKIVSVYGLGYKLAVSP